MGNEEKFEERNPGDRARLCELLYILERMSNKAWVNAQWAANDVYSSFESLVSIVFDDLDIYNAATMPDGYLGTYAGLPKDLLAIACAFDALDKKVESDRVRPDIAIASRADWIALSERCGALVNRAESWRRNNCDTSNGVSRE